MKKQPGKIKVICTGDPVWLDHKNIMLLESDSNYTHIFTSTGRYLIRYTLKTVLRKMASDCIVRINRSHAINVNYVIDGLTTVDQVLVQSPSWRRKLPVNLAVQGLLIVARQQLETGQTPNLALQYLTKLDENNNGLH